MRKQHEFVTIPANNTDDWFIAYLLDDYDLMTYYISRGIQIVPPPKGEGRTRMAALANLAHQLQENTNE